MYAQFRKNPFFLQQYTVASFVVLSICSLILYLVSPVDWLWIPVLLAFAHSSFVSILVAGLLGLLVLGHQELRHFNEVELISWAIVGAFVGMWSNVLIHNAAHNIIKPAWLNRLVGELAGLQLLSGFPGFAVLHMQHHIHADDEHLDPHPNLPGQTFWQYINETRARLRLTFAQMVASTWQSRPEVIASWRRIKWMLPVNRSLRAAVLLMVLGSKGFVFGFIISHIVTQLAFAVINFYSHRRQADGTVEILNLDHHFIFKLLNRCFSGAFYHRNHHINPKLFNPMRLGGIDVRKI